MNNFLNIGAALLQLDHLTTELGEVVDCVVLAVRSEYEAHAFGHGGWEPERGDRIFLSLLVL